MIKSVTCENEFTAWVSYLLQVNLLCSPLFDWLHVYILYFSQAWRSPCGNVGFVNTHSRLVAVAACQIFHFTTMQGKARLTCA